MSEWIKIAPLNEVPKAGSRVVKNGAVDIAIFRTDDDRVFALHDKCPHKGGPLSQGIVYGNKIACPLHSWKISLVDGNAEEPDEGHTACFNIKVEDNNIYLEL